MKIPEQWLHIGTDAIERHKFRPIINRMGMPKAYGGLWASPYRLNADYYSDWQEFWHREMGVTGRHDAVIFSFKKAARIFVIDTQDDLIRLIDEVGAAESILPLRSLKQIDFENAKNHYDVIYLTEQGQWETRMPFERMEYNLYGWDVESCFILNYDVIENQRSMSILVET